MTLHIVIIDIQSEQIVRTDKLEGEDIFDGTACFADNGEKTITSASNISLDDAWARGLKFIRKVKKKIGFLYCEINQ